MKNRLPQTSGEAIKVLMFEAAHQDKASARRYPSLKRALQTLQIREDGDDWHSILGYLGYHDSRARQPFDWVLPKPRPKSFRLALVSWKQRRRGRYLQVEHTDGYNVHDYAREAKVELEGHRTAREAKDAADKIRAKPDKDGVYPHLEAQPVYE